MAYLEALRGFHRAARKGDRWLMVMRAVSDIVFKVAGKAFDETKAKTSCNETIDKCKRLGLWPMSADKSPPEALVLSWP